MLLLLDGAADECVALAMPRCYVTATASATAASHEHKLIEHNGVLVLGMPNSSENERGAMECDRKGWKNKSD